MSLAVLIMCYILMLIGKERERERESILWSIGPFLTPIGKILKVQNYATMINYHLEIEGRQILGTREQIGGHGDGCCALLLH